MKKKSALLRVMSAETKKRVIFKPISLSIIYIRERERERERESERERERERERIHSQRSNRLLSSMYFCTVKVFVHHYCPDFVIPLAFK